MLLKLAALGAIGYAAYQYFESRKGTTPSPSTISEPDLSDPQVAIAGGPLSTEASLHHTGQPLSPA
ncbi:MAG: hypothetical protein RLZZ08_1250 [Pseudomonadota bacterium]|jgi:uncharacterized membrane protein YebE (DUF533 family)